MSRISSSRVTACGFSILAITAARPRVIFFASAMSSGRWMNDSATQSMPASSAASRSERSFCASAENGIVVSGRLTPLRSDRLPPTSTRVTILPSATSVAVSRTLPSSSSSCGRARSTAKISGCGRCTRVTLPGVLSVSNVKVAPFGSTTGPPSNCPTRSFGPCRSTRIPIGRPNSSSTERMFDTSSRMRSCDVWLMLMRKTSAPARNSAAIIERSDDAGPSVATILVRRKRRISSCVSGMAGWSGRPVAGTGVSGTRDCRGCCGVWSAESVSCTVHEGCSPVSTSKKPVRS